VASSFKLGVLREMAAPVLRTECLLRGFFKMSGANVPHSDWFESQLPNCVNYFAASCVVAPVNVAIGAISSPGTCYRGTAESGIPSERLFRLCKLAVMGRVARPKSKALQELRFSTTV
jgi:hypothetical protein